MCHVQVIAAPSPLLVMRRVECVCPWHSRARDCGSVRRGHAGGACGSALEGLAWLSWLVGSSCP